MNDKNTLALIALTADERLALDAIIRSVGCSPSKFTLESKVKYVLWTALAYPRFVKTASDSISAYCKAENIDKNIYLCGRIGATGRARAA
jgi:hypothetical protein